MSCGGREACLVILQYSKVQYSIKNAMLYIPGKSWQWLAIGKDCLFVWPGGPPRDIIFMPCENCMHCHKWVFFCKGEEIKFGDVKEAQEMAMAHVSDGDTQYGWLHMLVEIMHILVPKHNSGNTTWLLWFHVMGSGNGARFWRHRLVLVTPCDSGYTTWFLWCRTIFMVAWYSGDPGNSCDGVGVWFWWRCMTMHDAVWCWRCNIFDLDSRTEALSLQWPLYTELCQCFKYLQSAV